MDATFSTMIAKSSVDGACRGHKYSCSIQNGIQTTKGETHMNDNSETIEPTDIATRMRNATAKGERSYYQQYKWTMTNFNTQEQLDAVLGGNCFSVLKPDAKRIKIGDVFAYKFFHFTITETCDDADDFGAGLTSFHFKRTGPFMPV
jgi:hypothetical protein